MEDFNSGEGKQRLEKYLNDCWEQKKPSVEKVDQYAFLINGTAKHDVDTFLADNRTLNEYQEYIIKYHNFSSNIPTNLSVITSGVLKIDFTEFVDTLHRQAKNLENAIIAHMFSAYLSAGKV